MDFTKTATEIKAVEEAKEAKAWFNAFAAKAIAAQAAADRKVEAMLAGK